MDFIPSRHRHAEGFVTTRGRKVEFVTFAPHSCVVKTVYAGNGPTNSAEERGCQLNPNPNHKSREDRVWTVRDDAMTTPLPVHETLSIARCSSQWQYMTGHIELAHHADLGSAAVITHGFLFDNILPPIPSSVDLQRLRCELRSGDVIRKNGWRGFETQPKRSKRRESQAFRVDRISLLNMRRCNSQRR